MISISSNINTGIRIDSNGGIVNSQTRSHCAISRQ
jgi:hypothetical protein